MGNSFHIVTFGCAANEADSQRIAAYYAARGMTRSHDVKKADTVIINTCMIREMAENRVYGLVNNLSLERQAGRKVKIVVTGCMTGMAVREKSGRMLGALRRRMPDVDEFLPIEEVGFENVPVRDNRLHALVPITNGCNNFCTFCVVPFTRGREVSRPVSDILDECRHVAANGFSAITLIGQNVNSYGADLLKQPGSGLHAPAYPSGTITYVKHLGRLRIPTLFPYLLRQVAGIGGINEVHFISSNPWDFSDDLIHTIAANKTVSRNIHLPVQSGDDTILKRMNRWYSSAEYLDLVGKIKNAIHGVTISTDIIVGFPGETDEQFANTVRLAESVGFSKAYVAMYSDRPLTAAHSAFGDPVPHTVKKHRWKILENLINQKNLKEGTYR